MVVDPFPQLRRRRHTPLLAALLAVSVLAPLTGHAGETEIRGGPGGGTFKDMCPPEARFLVGVSIRAGTWVDAIFPICAEYVQAEGRFRPGKRGATRHGGTGGSPLLKDGVCPPDRFLSGIVFGWTRKDKNPEFVDYVELQCSLISNPATPDTKVCLQTGSGCWENHPNREPTEFRGFTIATPIETICPAGEAATGLKGRSGIYVDALGLVCDPRPLPRPVKQLGKAKLVATAKSDAYVFNNPVAPRERIGVMLKGTSAPVLDSHKQGGWKLKGVAAGTDGWVAADQLTVTRAP